MNNPISWFPGHMKTALDMVRAELKSADVIIYVLDARAPLSCLNPKFEEFTARKPVVFVLNKADLGKGGVKTDLTVLNSKPGLNSKFDSNSKSDLNGKPGKFGSDSQFDVLSSAPQIFLNSTQSGAGQKVVTAINRLLADKIKSAQEKGINKTIRAVVIGVTNCGKSTLINNLAGSGKTLTGDRPGVTRTKQWVPVNDLLWVLDTPGTLWPSFENPQVGKNLAYIGSIKDDILDLVELAKSLIADLKRLDPDCLDKRFGADDFDGICKKRGYILRGGILDEERAAKAILTEFRAGKLGRFNLDSLL